MNGRWDVTLAHRGEKQKERRTKVVLVTVRRHVVASWVGADSPFSAFFSRLPHDFTRFSHEPGYNSRYSTWLKPGLYLYLSVKTTGLISPTTLELLGKNTVNHYTIIPSYNHALYRKKKKRKRKKAHSFCLFPTGRKTIIAAKRKKGISLGIILSTKEPSYMCRTMGKKP